MHIQMQDLCDFNPASRGFFTHPEEQINLRYMSSFNKSKVDAPNISSK